LFATDQFAGLDALRLARFAVSCGYSLSRTML
jgi:hypothetical protein